MSIIKTCLFLCVVIYASVLDVMTRIIPNRVYLLQILTGLICLDTQSLAGLILTAIPLCVTAAIFRGFGGGDVKFGSLCGFILKGMNGWTALLIGAVVCLITVPIIRKVSGDPQKWRRVPLIPFFSVGAACVALLQLF